MSFATILYKERTLVSLWVFSTTEVGLLAPACSQKPLNFDNLTIYPSATKTTTPAPTATNRLPQLPTHSPISGGGGIVNSYKQLRGRSWK